MRRISPDEKVPEHDLHADPEYCSSPGFYNHCTLYVVVLCAIKMDLIRHWQFLLVMGEAPPPSRRSHRRPKVRLITEKKAIEVTFHGLVKLCIDWC